MNTPYESRQLLIAAALASAGIHAIFALALHGVRLATPTNSLVNVRLMSEDELVLAMPEPADPPETRLGVLDSDLDPTPDWLGFADPTPHQAPVSETAQSQLTPEPAAPSEPAVNIAPATNEPAPIAPNPISHDTIELGEIADALADAIVAVRSAGASVAEITAQGVRAATQSAAKQGLPGELSDRESDATAREQPVEVRPGRVASAQGLEITTRRPQWRALTTMTTSPINPVVRIDFGRDGKVINAQFIDGHGTGFPDVDGPLLNTIITRWTAKGRPIDELSEAPDAHVSITMKIILSGPSI